MHCCEQFNGKQTHSDEQDQQLKHLHERIRELDDAHTQQAKDLQVKEDLVSHFKQQQLEWEEQRRSLEGKLLVSHRQEQEGQRECRQLKQAQAQVLFLKSN